MTSGSDSHITMYHTICPDCVWRHTRRPEPHRPVDHLASLVTWPSNRGWTFRSGSNSRMLDNMQMMAKGSRKRPTHCRHRETHICVKQVIMLVTDQPPKKLITICLILHRVTEGGACLSWHWARTGHILDKSPAGTGLRHKHRHTFTPGPFRSGLTNRFHSMPIFWPAQSDSHKKSQISLSIGKIF